ncbi:hypothetical protein [Rubrimonas cliftonensis]|uniref:Lipopolysaccharide assembly protein A domain-containing protein n=1 Tax=Rubrimonas cliftonensis TaxID=89524 RepID=A0A1H4DXG0_9RHOB|nr:hypothetical protein [Rubrimonas cliftonensis]SEA77198.1 hypothetical protein SAMN05444370_11187 [Rubrimonas cliftonensis]
MRILTYLLIGIVAIVVIALSVANRHVVDVGVAPDFSAYGLPPSPRFGLPLYVLALACGALGFVLGAAREYIREGRVRRRAAAARREVGELKREVSKLKRDQNLDEDDEIIALTSR